MHSHRSNISFIETIKVEDGALLHVEYHNRRFNHTRKEFFGSRDQQDLRDLITLPGSVAAGVFKCRIIYDAAVTDIQFQPYSMRNLSSLKLVEDNAIEYRFKYADRSAIDRLFAMRGACDDILIVREGLLTDTSYANIAFWDGGSWITPRLPLLHGTCRARLLENNEIREGDLRLKDMNGFFKVRIFNAMMDQVVPMDQMDIVGFG